MYDFTKESLQNVRIFNTDDDFESFWFQVGDASYFYSEMFRCHEKSEFDLGTEIPEKTAYLIENFRYHEVVLTILRSEYHEKD